jgi:4-hydroxymandelate oxidase
MMNALFNRRHAVTGFASWLAASPLLRGQQLAGEPPGRIAPVDELVNAFEFGAMAERQLGSATFERIAGSDRRAFDRMTLRPRMMVNTLNLDLTTELFSEKMFAPILVGPVSDQKRFHAEGELATVQGASAAKAVTVISSRSSYPLEQIVAQSKTTLWFQVYPEPDMNAVRTRVERAVDLGCKAVCITVGAPYQPADQGGVSNPSELPVMGNPGLNWSAIDRLRQGVHVPVLLKGIMSPEEARTAVERGIAGIVVSDYGGLLVNGLAAPIEVLPSIAEAVGGKAPLLVDGGFRRGTDMLKGLALGARAILLGRPPMWGLAAYGADGVCTLLKLLQTELARDMAMCGKVTVGDIDRNLVTIHRR